LGCLVFWYCCIDINVQESFVVTLRNDTFLRALRRQPTEYTPLWLMRQAGRYLPEYNATRSRAGSFLGLAKNPAYATEVTLQPLDRFPLDAAILFSDILTVPDAMGLGLSFEAGEGPKFARPLREENEILKLAVPDMAELQYVFDAVSEIRRALIQNGQQRVPLIGFSGSPWTLACYMVEGGGSSDFRRVKALLYSRPDLMHHILNINAQAVTAYLNAQIDAGAQAVMIFDSWGGALADGVYQQFSLAYMRQILTGLKRQHDGEHVPVIVFTKGGGLWLHDIANLDVPVGDLSIPDAIGLDWTVNLAQARRLVGARCALQGNLDPNVLFAAPEQVAEQARRVIDDFSSGGNGLDGHIFNLGHGISQFTPPEQVGVLAETVHAYSREKRLAMR
jgi:uroporphyrinogen decarboxylase